MKKVLVTGAQGYVGKKVVEELLTEDYCVVKADIAETYDKTDDFINVDITKREELESKLGDVDIDGIIHLASLPGDTGNPHQMLDVNVMGFSNILELARRKKIKKVVVASSISAYEWYPATAFRNPDYMPVDEKHPCRPKDMYSTSKRIQELLAATYYHQYSLNVCALGFTAVVGPSGKGGGRSWLDFAKQLLEGEKVELPFFSADEMCHFVDIRDVAKMCLAAYQSKNSWGEIFNCAGPAAVRGNEMAGIVQEIVPGIEVKYGYPWSMAQGGEIEFDMSKAKDLLGFAPIFSMKESISNIYEWATGEKEKLCAQEKKHGYTDGVNKTK